MKLHNSLTKNLIEVQPLDDKRLRIYSCGPTVYDQIHIGNLSSFIYADSLRRVAIAAFGEAEQVMNFTDVDDKTIASSRQRYPDLEPMQALKKLTEHYSLLFLSDMQAVGNDVSAMHFIKATDSIQDMQRLIKDLVRNGYAYLADDGIYFSIEAYRKAGKTYGQLTEISADSTSEARIQNDEYDKAAVHDFALWKRHKSGEPSWEFEIDGQSLAGRPGWHIECSAMSRRMLGQPFDVHTGGIDLLFPHHENEIAQSTALESNPKMATIFVHNEHLLVDNQKMSKSLKNFYTLKNIQDKGFEPLAFRLLVLQAHYRKQAHFSWDNLQAAQNRLRELQAMAVLRWQVYSEDLTNSTLILDTVALELQKLLENDLDTPQALAYLSTVSGQLLTETISKQQLPGFNDTLQSIDALLGLQLTELPDINDSQKQLINNRQLAREAQNWVESDMLRDQLQSEGIGLRDTSAGAIWSYLWPAR